MYLNHIFNIFLFFNVLKVNHLKHEGHIQFNCLCILPFPVIWESLYDCSIWWQKIQLPFGHWWTQNKVKALHLYQHRMFTLLNMTIKEGDLSLFLTLIPLTHDWAAVLCRSMSTIKYFHEILLLSTKISFIEHIWEKLDILCFKWHYNITNLPATFEIKNCKKNSAYLGGDQTANSKLRVRHLTHWATGNNLAG